MKFFLAAFACCVISVVSGGISTDCMRCIRQVEGGKEGRCRYDVYSDSCGPYQIKLEYWCDAKRISGASCKSASSRAEYRKCTKNTACSERIVRAYMNRYGRYCTGGTNPTCEVYARIHNGGPKGCRYRSTQGYWNKVNRCCRGRRC